MEMSDDLANLTHDSCCFNFCVGSWPFFDCFTKVAVEGAFHDRVKVEEIVEEAINFYDVWMINTLLYFQLSNELLYHIALSDLSFRDYLYCEDQSRLTLHCKYHSSKCSLPQLSYNDEIFDAKLALLRQLHCVQTIFVIFEAIKERRDLLFGTVIVRLFADILDLRDLH